MKISFTKFHKGIKSNFKKNMKIMISFACVLAIGITAMMSFAGKEAESGKNDFITYAEFNVTYSALEKAMNIDIESRNSEVKISWIDILAYLGATYGGNFSSYKAADMDKIAARLKDGEQIAEITKDMKYFSYYFDVYNAALGGYLGDYTEYSADESGKITTTQKYGLKAYSPIAKTFPFSDSNDFGVGRSYGFQRRHLGHDMMAATGTPVIAIEDGVVENLGWNQYGGWRIGIRSLDKKRYYYYAHLRQNRPYHPDVKLGGQVKAGDVIGYVGRTGYSTKENSNNIETSHLHWGLELVFDESQKESDNEIWIDVYAITRLLQKHQSTTVREAATKEFFSLRQDSLREKPVTTPPLTTATESTTAEN
ncbi:MAG: M23 family metallopeptidase [Oscillospiraceae bacterium]|jgi:murein DD-endopeptidase MepM/ murein hydrolase activator NlpD|nr:M23 family metallopeptidase [Oscillospiraceae bacterium]